MATTAQSPRDAFPIGNAAATGVGAKQWLFYVLSVIVVLLLLLWWNTSSPINQRDVGGSIGQNSVEVIVLSDTEGADGVIAAQHAWTTQSPATPVKPVTGKTPEVGLVNSKVPQTTADPSAELREANKALEEKRRQIAMQLVGSGQLVDAFSRALEDAKTAVFVLDISGSMAGEPYAAMRTALLQALEGLKPDQRFGVLLFRDDYLGYSQGSFSKSSSELCSHKDVKTVGEALRKLDGSGGTNPWPALKSGADLLQGASDRPAVLILLSDGLFVGAENESSPQLKNFRSSADGLIIKALSPPGGDLEVLKRIAPGRMVRQIGNSSP